MLINLLKIIASIAVGFLSAVLAAILVGALFGSHSEAGHDTINGGAFTGLLIVVIGVVAGIFFWRWIVRR